MAPGTDHIGREHIEGFHRPAMNIQIHCSNPDCLAPFSVPAELIGRRGRCRRCGASILIAREVQSGPLETGVAPELPGALAATLTSSPSALRPQALPLDLPDQSGLPGTAAAPEPARSLASTLFSSPSRPAALPRTPSPDLPEQFGRFRILGRLGRGGMGSVYKAYDSQIHREVALKIPHLGPQDGPAVLERFYREARTAATFDHPNLCPVYTVDQVEGVDYLTMPLLEGQPLSKCFEGRHPLHQRPVAALVRMLALAMEEAHGHGVVHRDLKPSNIMADAQRLLVIVDFGLSLRSGWRDLERHVAVPLDGDERITKAGSVLGTPAYMAPEQVSGDTAAIGPACDIYSLGVILYELLTGRLPFEGPAAVVLGLIKVSEPPRPSSLRPDLKPSLEAVCLKAMAKAPSDRFASMAEFAASLKVFLDHGEYTKAGIVPAGLLKPPLRDDDAPTSEERQSVQRLLAGSSPGPDHVQLGPGATLLAMMRGLWHQIGRVFLIVFLSLVGAAAILLIVLSRFSDIDRWYVIEYGMRKVPPLPQRTAQVAEGADRAGGLMRKVPPLPQRTAPIIPRSSRDGVAGAPADARREPAGLVRRFGPGGGYWVNRVSFSRDGRLAIATGGDVIWYNLESGRERRAFTDGPQFARSGLALSPDGQYFLTGHSNDPVLRLGDMASGREVRPYPGHTQGILGCALSPDGHWAASAGRDGTLRLWDVETGEQIHRFGGDAGVPRCVAFLSDGIRILSGHEGSGGRHPTCLWDVETGKVERTFEGHSGPVHAVAVLPDDRSFLSASEDGTVRLWEIGSGKQLQRVDHGGPVHSVAVSSDGRRVLSSGWGPAPKVLRLWDPSSLREIHRFPGHQGDVLDVAFSPDDRRALSSDTAGSVILWRLPPVDDPSADNPPASPVSPGVGRRL